MRLKIILLMFLGMFLISFVSAAAIEIEPIFVTQGGTYDLKLRCFDTNNLPCDYDNTLCQISIDNPDGSNIINNQTMTANPTYYNYTLVQEQTMIIGTHRVHTTCQGSNNAFSTWTYEVNAGGFASSYGFYFLIVLIAGAIVLLGLWKQDIWITALGTLSFYLIGLFFLMKGIAGMRNNVTLAISLVIIGLAAILSLKMGQEAIQ